MHLTVRWRPSISRRSSALTLTTCWITTIPRTTPWVERRRVSDPTNGNLNKSVLVEISTSTTCADEFSPWMNYSRPLLHAMMPHLRAANGICQMLTNTSQKRGAVITGMCSMESTSTPVSLSPISACSVTTTSITGLTNRPSCRRTRHGSSMACAASGFQRRS